MSHWYKYSALLFLIFFWYIITRLELVNALFLPSIPHTLRAFQKMIVTGELFSDISFTLYRAMSGFGIACLVGIPLGLCMGYSQKAQHFFELIVDGARSVPVTALFPLFFLIFGIGNTSKIAVVFWTCVTIIALHAMLGVHAGSQVRMKAARTLDVSGFFLFRSFVFPEALPNIFSGMRITSSLSLVVVIVAEMFGGAVQGIGYRIMNAQLVYNIPEMYAAIFVAGILGFGINSIVAHVEKRVVHWKGK